MDSVTETVAADSFGPALLEALARRPRAISPKYFYDTRGSELFEEICRLEEYYPTRTELDILTRCAADIAARIGPDVELVEFGAGSLTKVRILLDAMQRPVRYLPIDISGTSLREAAAQLAHAYPALPIAPVVGDYAQPLSLPTLLPAARCRVGFFPGSTIGNFTPAEALSFLEQTRPALEGGGMLLGVDLVKDPVVLHAAYNDARGVTGEFNLNVLARANRELGADFDLGNFAHYAFYNPWDRRIEMHLLSMRRQRVRVSGQVFEFEEGETLHTENSYKYTPDGVRELARRAGYAASAVWTDPSRWFSVWWLQAPGRNGALREGSS